MPSCCGRHQWWWWCCCCCCWCGVVVHDDVLSEVRILGNTRLPGRTRSHEIAPPLRWSARGVLVECSWRWRWWWGCKGAWCKNGYKKTELLSHLCRLPDGGFVAMDTQAMIFPLQPQERQYTRALCRRRPTQELDATQAGASSPDVLRR